MSKILDRILFLLYSWMYVSHHLAQQFPTQILMPILQVKELPVSGQNRRQTSNIFFRTE